MDDSAKKTVLIVEDDPATQQLLVALMRRDGFATVVAADGREAIDTLALRSFSLVILDLMMPSVGGHEVIEFLTVQNRTENVIVCTAAGPRMTANIVHGPVKAVVRKPFDIDALTSMVASLTPGD